MRDYLLLCQLGMYFLHVIYSFIFTTSLVVGVVVIILVWLFHIGGISYGLHKFHRRTLPNNHKELPGVSIIKPLTCMDPNLYENLKTFFTLKYPRYEILFCVQDYDNDVIDMIETLRAQHPHVESQVFVGSQPSDPRPKNEFQEEEEEYDDEYDDDMKLSKNTAETPVRSKPMSLQKKKLLSGSQKLSLNDGSVKNGVPEIINPKIFNMCSAYDKAQYPLVLISDSGMMMQEDTLYEMAMCMTDDVGLVHQMPFTSNRNGFAGSVEKVYFGTQHARMYMTINLIGLNCVTGMSCLFRKDCIDRVGGLKAFGRFIAEDYYIAYEISRQGFKLVVAPTPAQQNSGDYSIKAWMNRMIRWYKLRMRLSRVAYIEPLQECFSSAILAGFITNYLFEWNALVVTAFHILIWFICDYLILRVTQGGPLPFSKFEFAIAWLVRELSSFYIYIKAFTGSSTITWRGKEYRLGSGTRVEELYSLCPPQPTTPSLVVESPTVSSSTNSKVPVIG